MALSLILFMKINKKHSSTESNLLILNEKGKESPLSIAEIIEILSGKGQLLTILILCLPFCQPLQIPGLSTPFGLAIAFIGLRIAFGKNVWLPKSILEKKITPKTLQKIIKNVLWLVRKIKPWIHPRMTWLFDKPFMEIINGLLIFVLAIFLAMPLPIPFSNLVVAWAIFLIALGLLEDDGVVVILGYFVSIIAFAFFFAMVFLNIKVLLHFSTM